MCLTKELMAFFAPAESLPTPATLHGFKFLVQLGIVWHVCPAHFWLFNFRFDINGFKRLCGMTLLIMCIKEG